MKTINELYKDLSIDMGKSWNRDVSISVGARAVKNSLIGIVTTRKGEKPFNPDFGCDINDSLFENMNPLTANTIEKSITSAIRKFEKRVLKLSVNIQTEYDKNSVLVTIQFSILDNPNVLEQLKLQLSAVR